MHDFDIDREARWQADRQFKLGGEVFTHRPGVRPELMAEWEGIDANTSAVDALAITDRLIKAWIDTTDDPDAVKRFEVLRQREEDPISGGDLSTLIFWLYRQSTRRPTEPSTSSDNGHGTTGAPSTATSSTEPEPASTP
jgi:hypothetical protein